MKPILLSASTLALSIAIGGPALAQGGDCSWAAQWASTPGCELGDRGTSIPSTPGLGWDAAPDNDDCGDSCGDTCGDNCGDSTAGSFDLEIYLALAELRDLGLA